MRGPHVVNEHDPHIIWENVVPSGQVESPIKLDLVAISAMQSRMIAIFDGHHRLDHFRADLSLRIIPLVPLT